MGGRERDGRCRQAGPGREGGREGEKERAVCSGREIVQPTS